MRTKMIGENGTGLWVPESYELQRDRQPSRYEEVGTTGLPSYSGWITRAYNTELYWPGVADLYQRIWRSDPETAVVRHLWEAWAGDLSPEWDVPELIGPDGDPIPPTDDDKRAAYFANTVSLDIDGGLDGWLSACMTRAPFFGWGWWEAPLGLRKDGWAPPGEDEWESRYDDGLVGIRRLAFRDYSSFQKWDIDDKTGRVNGMEQNDPPNPAVTIPVERSVHIRYGDLDNPEGLATLEAVWRLEYIKRGLEMVQGIGYEHAAGHAKFTVAGKLDGDAKAMIGKAARALLTAQEGNYITELVSSEGNPVFTSSVMDVPFQAAPAILEAIRYYGILKLSLYGMQFVALSSLSGAGSFAALNDASEMALLMFNSMAQGFVRQGGEQIGRRLFNQPANRAAFPQMTRRPALTVNPLQKDISLTELATFLQAIEAIMPLGDEDYIQVRKRSKVLPETLPETEAPEPEQPDSTDDGGDVPDTPDEMPEGEGEANMARGDYASSAMVAFMLPGEIARRLALQPDGLSAKAEPLPAGELHLTLLYLGEIVEEMQPEKLIRALRRFAERRPPLVGKLNGYGRFTNTHRDGYDAVYAVFDAYDLPAFRQDLVSALSRIGIESPSEHGFVPHITLAYLPDSMETPLFELPDDEIVFDAVTLAWGNDYYSFALGGDEGEANMAKRPIVPADDEQPTRTTDEATVTQSDIDRAVRRFRRWAEEEEPELARLLDAEVVDGDDE